MLHSVIFICLHLYLLYYAWYFTEWWNFPSLFLPAKFVTAESDECTNCLLSKLHWLEFHLINQLVKTLIFDFECPVFNYCSGHFCSIGKIVQFASLLFQRMRNFLRIYTVKLKSLILSYFTHVRFDLCKG